MIYVHSLGRASRYYSAGTALAPGGLAYLSPNWKRGLKA